MTAQLRNLVEAVHPSGTFWRGPEANRYYDSVAGSFASNESFINGIFDAIQPETAPFSVLVQYWNYIRGSLDCIAMPSEVEDLRAAVVRLYRSPFSGTVEGLIAMISGFLPLVDVRESLLTSALPGILPLVLEATGRVLEIWSPPLKVTEFQVDCVARRFMRDGDVLRAVRPFPDIFQAGEDAQNITLRWTYCGGCVLRVQRWDDEPSIGSMLQTVDFATPAQHGTETLDTVFAIPATQSLATQWITIEVLKDFGSGLEAATARSQTEINLEDIMIVVDDITAGSDVNSLIVLAPAGGDVDISYEIQARLRVPESEATSIRLMPRVGGVTVGPGVDFTRRQFINSAPNAGAAGTGFWELSSGVAITESVFNNPLVVITATIEAAQTVNGQSVERRLCAKVTYHSDDGAAAIGNQKRELVASWRGLGDIDGFELTTVANPSAGIKTGSQLKLLTPAVKPFTS